ncbi:MAG: VOC family protein [Caulobacterales bacterium]
MTAPVSSLIRAALFVADLERSAAFYGALGLTEIYFEGELDGASAAAVLSVPAGARTRCRIVKRPQTPNFGMVGLFAVSNPAPPSLPETGASPRIGDVALVFYVSDFDAALEAARAAGARVIGPVTLFTMPHRTQREVCLRDPDGVLVNLIDRPPEEQFRTELVRV